MNNPANLAQTINTELTDTIDRLDRLSSRVAMSRKVKNELIELSVKVYMIRLLTDAYISTYAPANKPA